MTNETAAQGFKGWALVELFGHQKVAGHVQTVSFGTGVMFQIDVPSLPEREFLLESPQYVEGRWTGAGATVQRAAKEGFTRLLGVGAIYAINPCTEAAAMLAIEQLQRPETKLISPPAAAQIEAAVDSEDDTHF